MQITMKQIREAAAQITENKELRQGVFERVSDLLCADSSGKLYMSVFEAVSCTVHGDELMDTCTGKTGKLDDEDIIRMDSTLAVGLIAGMLMERVLHQEEVSSNLLPHIGGIHIEYNFNRAN